MRSVRNLALVLVTGLAVACTDGTLPSDPSDGAPSFHVEGTTGQSRHQQLKAQLAAEKSRIKRERDQRKGEFERARAEWKLFRRDQKRNEQLNSKLVDLLRCEPREYQGDAEIIGPTGGTLHIGEHELVIPRGALTEETLISAEARTSSLVDVEFQPEGLTFQRPARLTLSYKNCEVPPTLDLLVAYLGVGNKILEFPASEDYRSYSEVTGEINHFSRYAVAY
jgi:hypothetical protein